MINEHARAGARLPIHEAQPMTRNVRKTADPRLLLAAHDESLRAPRAADQGMKPGFEKGFQGPRKHGSGRLQNRDVKTGNEALTIIQRTQRINAALKPDLEMQIGGIRHMPLQHG